MDYTLVERMPGIIPSAYWKKDIPVKERVPLYSGLRELKQASSELSLA